MHAVAAQLTDCLLFWLRTIAAMVVCPSMFAGLVAWRACRALNRWAWRMGRNSSSSG
jgi:hypothetical protein